MFRVTKEARAFLAEQFRRVAESLHAAAERVEQEDIPTTTQAKIAAIFEKLPDYEHGMMGITLSSTKEPELEVLDVNDCRPDDVIFRYEGKPVLAVSKEAAELMDDVTMFVEHNAGEPQLSFRGPADDAAPHVARLNRPEQT